MSDNKHHKRPASSSIPSAPLRFLPAYNAVWQAKCHFRQRWNTLTEHHPGHYGLHIHDLYLSLLGTPILGELVNELNLVLNEKGESRLNFFIRIPSNKPIYRMRNKATIKTVTLRVKMKIPPPTPPRVGSAMVNLPVSVRAIVRASGSGMRENDRMLLHGSLSNIRLFHILELLIIIHDRIEASELFNKGERTPIWNHILPAIVAYTLRSFCTDCRVGDFWNSVDGARVAALLEDPCNDERIQRIALRFVRVFLQRWSTSTCPDLSGWKDMYQWVDYERLTLRSWPVGLPSLYLEQPLFLRHRENCAFLDCSPGARLNKMTLQSFCRFMFENEASPEAHAVITQACRWVNKNSPVRHEFLVVDAEITGCKFWVRIDRFCNDGDGAAMQWEALDTVTVGIDTKPFGFEDERLEKLSTATFLIIDAQRRLPQLRDLGTLLLAVEVCSPLHIFHQENCWLVSSILAGTLRTLFGGNWAGDRLDCIQADELANFVDCCKSLYEKTSADYWRTYDVGKFPALQVAQVMDGAEDPLIYVVAPEPLDIQSSPVSSLRPDSPDSIIQCHDPQPLQCRTRRFTWQRFSTAVRIPFS